MRNVPYLASGGSTGVLLLHGFTGSPTSVLPWAEFLAGCGYTVSAPCLPGHGTHWRDLNKTSWRDWYAAAESALLELAGKADVIFIAGFSMGGALAARLTERHRDLISGLMLLNPALRDRLGLVRLYTALRFVMPSLKPRASDIAKPDAPKHGYAETPLWGLHSLSLLLRDIKPRLARIDKPILLFRSMNDHVVSSANSGFILERAASSDITVVLLERSYHVATLDYDAEIIHRESLSFIQRLEVRPHD